MPNSYFQFKRFRIDQGQTAMKVTTEGCVFGAWVASVAQPSSRILDVGAGTGLLSLMLAQQFADAKVDAVELDQAAAHQATNNFGQSPWADRLHLHRQNAMDFEGANQYGLMITNPPFYNQSLLSPASNLNLARHEDALSQKALVHLAAKHLVDMGSLYVLYPEREANTFAELAERDGLYLSRELSVFNSPGSKKFRVIGEYHRVQREVKKEVLNIKDVKGDYTADFIALLKPYYLHL